MLKKSFSFIISLLLLISICPLSHAENSQDCGAKLLAITFDDGPGKYTTELLDGLAARDVKATFFVSGCNAVNYPKTLKRIVDEGHQLGSHTYNHKNLNKLTKSSIKSEISRTQDLITKAGGSENAYIRPPYGNANDTVKAASMAPLIHWSVDPEDWKSRNASSVKNNIVNKAYDGAIILCHDIYSTTVEGALAAIDSLTAEGYEFVTVEELFLRRGITPKAGELYYNAKNHGINLPAEEVGSQAYDESRLTEHWGYSSLCSCIDKGYMSPAANGKWYPNKFVTRSEFVYSLAKFCGIDSSYVPVSDFRYADVDILDENYPYIMWAYDTGLMVGDDDNNFMVKSTLTREQMAVIISRFMKLNGISVIPNDISIFADAKNIALWAVEGVGECAGTGILQGDGTNFMPKGKLTRAQIATILCKLENVR